MNLAESKQKVLTYIDEYSNNGNLIDEIQNADYTLKHNRLADGVQKEIAKIIKIPAKYEITQNPIDNQLGKLYGFDLVQHTDEDLIYSAIGSKAYYFEVDNIATIYIEVRNGGIWQIVETIENTDKRKFTTHKGLIANTNNEVRIRFSGDYVYNIRNRALFEYPFPTADDIPDYRSEVSYEMPEDFMELDKVIHRTDPRAYKDMIDYHWENKRTFVTNYFNTGSFTIHYWKYPKTILPNADDTTEFEIDVAVQELIPIKVAALTVIKEDADLSTTLLNLYEVELTRLLSGQTPEKNEIETIFYM